MDIMISFKDVENHIDDYCTENKKAPTADDINNYIKADKRYYGPNTDTYGVEQTKLKSFTVKSVNLKYSEEDIECQGSIEVYIKKLNWTHTFPIPAKVNTQKVIEEARS